MRKSKVFLDSNVIISGLISAKTSPFFVLKAIEEGKARFYSGNFILEEVERNLASKAPSLLPYFWILWNKLKPRILDLPNKKEIEKYKKTVNYLPDQVILSACEKKKIDYLVTLDKKHLLNKKVQEQTKVKILRPEEFLKILPT